MTGLQQDALHSTVLCLEGIGELKNSKGVDKVLRRSIETSITRLEEAANVSVPIIAGQESERSEIDAIIAKSKRLVDTQATVIRDLVPAFPEDFDVVALFRQCADRHIEVCGIELSAQNTSRPSLSQP